jgi:hypothetical protein
MARQQPAARKESRSKRDKQGADSGMGTKGHDDEVASYEKELAGYLQERIRPGLNRGSIPLLARSIAKEIARREHPNGASEDAGAEAEQSAEAEDQHSAEADSKPAEDDEQAEADDEQAEDDDEQAEADDEQAEADEEYSAEADEDEPEAGEEQVEEDGEDSADGDDEREEAVAAFEDEMQELQADLGEDWILRFSVQGEDVWLTAEKDDGSQRLEAPTAEVLLEAVALLNEAGGRST